MSDFSALGLTIQYSDPLPYASRDLYTQAWYTTRVNYGTVQLFDTWNHTIDADGGYKSASFTIKCTQNTAEDWLERGLFRHIELYNSNLLKRGEYFVNTVKVTLGGLTVTRGPLMNVANRVGINYTPVTDMCSEDDPTVMLTGEATQSILQDDTTSQDLYGIQEAWLSGGTLMDRTTNGDHCTPPGTPTDQVDAIRGAFLNENKYPETSQELSIGESGAEPSVTIDCLGYGAWLDRYVYTDGTSHLTTCDDKIKNVVNGDANRIFTQDYFNIDYNGYLVDSAETENRFAKTIIDEIVSLGDIYDNRWTFGIYNERMAHYHAIPTKIEYYHRIIDGRQVITTMSGAIVQPWDILPCKWVFLSDFMVGRTQAATLRLDPRAMMIESVKYTAPYGLQLSGRKVGSFAQLMAKRAMLK